MQNDAKDIYQQAHNAKSVFNDKIVIGLMLSQYRGALLLHILHMYMR